MTILQDTDTPQTVKFIPRVLNTGTGFATFTDKTTKEVFTYAVTLTIDRYYNEFTHALTDLVEGHTYTLSFGKDADETFRGFALCTNQSEYSVHDGEYTERTTTNDYIILD